MIFNPGFTYWEVLVVLVLSEEVELLKRKKKMESLKTFKNIYFYEVAKKSRLKQIRWIDYV